VRVGQNTCRIFHFSRPIATPLAAGSTTASFVNAILWGALSIPSDSTRVSSLSPSSSKCPVCLLPYSQKPRHGDNRPYQLGLDSTSSTSLPWLCLWPHVLLRILRIQMCVSKHLEPISINLFTSPPGDQTISKTQERAAMQPVPKWCLSLVRLLPECQ